MGAAVQALQQQGLDVAWHCPQLPPSPAQAMAELQALVADWPRERMAVIGSSLGGFYATALAERLGCRAALINPAVAPARDLARHIGEQTAFHDPQARFFLQVGVHRGIHRAGPLPADTGAPVLDAHRPGR